MQALGQGECQATPGPAAIIARHMPIYEYKCPNGHHFEVVQRMTDEPVAICEVCDEPVERVFRPVAVHFKGSGFYTTDYARQAGSAASGDGSPDAKKPAESKEGGSQAGGSKSGEKAKASSGGD
jgi:putative FmdB family regulatory protein